MTRPYSAVRNGSGIMFCGSCVEPIKKRKSKKQLKDVRGEGQKPNHHTISSSMVPLKKKDNFLQPDVANKPAIKQNQYYYSLRFHTHDNHCHASVVKGDAANHQHQCHGGNCGDSHPQVLNQNSEGCPCCVASIDLDEVATALNEIAKNSGAEKHESLGEVADFSSGAHWGIFLGISGPLALIGLTAAIRNIKGTLNNREKLHAAIQGLQHDIDRYKKELESVEDIESKEKLAGVIHRLEAFSTTLHYSQFDTHFNLVVPGVLNGASSAIVISAIALDSFWALPIIALYAGCQTLRNGYDLWRTWNTILPEEARGDVELYMQTGIRKINQITASKRKFYTANTLGFSAFTAGAAMTTLALASVVTYGAALPVGLALLSAGAVSTGVTNNIWTAKFRPRNGDIGIAREALDKESVIEAIAERREQKRIIKNYTLKHLPPKMTERFGCALLSAFPYCNEKGADLLHQVNKSRMAASSSTKDDLKDLLVRIITVRKLLREHGNHQETSEMIARITALEPIEMGAQRRNDIYQFREEMEESEQIFAACKELNLDVLVVERFIQNAIFTSSSEHNTAIRDRQEYKKKLKGSGLFTIKGYNNMCFDIHALERNSRMKRLFIQSVEESLLFDYVEKLKYEQYGLNDFYWALDKQKKQTHKPLQDKPANGNVLSVKRDEEAVTVTTNALHARAPSVVPVAEKKINRSRYNAESAASAAQSLSMIEERSRAITVKEAQSLAQSITKDKSLPEGYTAFIEIMRTKRKDGSIHIIYQDPSDSNVDKHIHYIVESEGKLTIQHGSATNAIIPVNKISEGRVSGIEIHIIYQGQYESGAGGKPVATYGVGESILRHISPLPERCGAINNVKQSWRNHIYMRGEHGGEAALAGRRI